MSKKYNKKSNMKQAMYEMFGVGEEQTTPEEQGEAAECVKDVSVQEVPGVKGTDREGEETAEVVEESAGTFVEMIAAYEPEPKYPASYLSPGTVFEGTLKVKGDVEIAGEFNGDVFAENNVILSSVMNGNVCGGDLNLVGCTLIGDITAKGYVIISEDSRVCGNISAKEVRCAGRVTGDLDVSGDTALEHTAVINGVIKTKTMSMVQGAMIKGGIEMNAMLDK